VKTLSSPERFPHARLLDNQDQALNFAVVCGLLARR
jgi:hypothetical protein